jgi:hypothetical protein
MSDKQLKGPASRSEAAGEAAGLEKAWVQKTRGL